MVVAHDVADACLHSRDGIVGGADSETPASGLEAETSAPSAPVRSRRGIFADHVRNADIVVHNVSGGTAERLAVTRRADVLEHRSFSTQEGRLVGRRAERVTPIRAEGVI